MEKSWKQLELNDGEMRVKEKGQVRVSEEQKKEKGKGEWVRYK